MAHLDVLFPLPASFGTDRGPEFDTRVYTNEGLDRQVKVSRPWPMYGYSIRLDNRKVAAFESVESLFNVCYGPGHSFDIRDPIRNKSCNFFDTPTATDQPAGTGDGAETDFQPLLTWSAGGQTTEKPIYRPVASSLLVAVDGTPQASGWTWNTTTSRIVFDTAPGNGLVVTWGGEFYFPVAFTSNDFQGQFVNKSERNGDFFIGATVTLEEVDL